MTNPHAYCKLTVKIGLVQDFEVITLFLCKLSNLLITLINVFYLQVCFPSQYIIDFIIKCACVLDWAPSLKES